MNGVQSNVAEEKRGAEHLLDGGSELERLAQAERGRAWTWATMCDTSVTTRDTQ